jgi:signal transduction histidine kinase
VDDRAPVTWLAACGALLGACIALLEFAYYYELVQGAEQPAMLASLVLGWGGEGVVLGVTLGLIEARAAPRPLGAWSLALGVTLAATVGVFAWQTFMHLVLRGRFGLQLLRDYAGQPVDLPSVAVYHMWLMLLFGGLAAAVYGSRQRHARMLAALRAAELARETSQRRLAEARLAGLRARIDPESLFETLARLERMYEADPPGADRLLEEVIASLRAAVADVRASIGQTFPKEVS